MSNGYLVEFNGARELGRYAVGPTTVGAAHYLVGKMLAGHPKCGDKVEELQKASGYGGGNSWEVHCVL